MEGRGCEPDEPTEPIPSPVIPSHPLTCFSSSRYLWFAASSSLCSRAFSSFTPRTLAWDCTQQHSSRGGGGRGKGIPPHSAPHPLHSYYQGRRVHTISVFRYFGTAVIMMTVTSSCEGGRVGTCSRMSPSLTAARCSASLILPSNSSFRPLSSSRTLLRVSPQRSWSRTACCSSGEAEPVEC